MHISKVNNGFVLEEHALKGFFDKGLAPREISSLMLRAIGLTAKEAAAEMNVSPATENKRQQTINFKLGAKNATQAISEAFKRGIIAHCMIFILIGFAEPQPDQKFQRPLVRISTRIRRDEIS